MEVDTYRRDVITTKIGGGISIRYNGSDFLEMNSGILNVLKVISLARQEISSRLKELSEAENAIKVFYGQKVGCPIRSELLPHGHSKR